VVEGASREAGNERFVTREPTESSATRSNTSSTSCSPTT